MNSPIRRTNIISGHLPSTSAKQNTSQYVCLLFLYGITGLINVSFSFFFRTNTGFRDLRCSPTSATEPSPELVDFINTMKADPEAKILTREMTAEQRKKYGWKGQSFTGYHPRVPYCVFWKQDLGKVLLPMLTLMY